MEHPHEIFVPGLLLTVWSLATVIAGSVGRTALASRVRDGSRGVTSAGLRQIGRGVVLSIVVLVVAPVMGFQYVNRSIAGRGTPDDEIRIVAAMNLDLLVSIACTLVTVGLLRRAGRTHAPTVPS